MRGTPITISGPPGSGKTTSARRLGERLHREVVSVGELFRAMARERSLDLLAFGALAAKDPRIDHDLDERMVGLASGTRVLEGRIIGELLYRRNLPVYRIQLTAREEVRAERISSRENLPTATVLERMRSRETNERERYYHFYGIDLDHLAFERTVDTSDLTPEGVVGLLLEGLPPELHPS